MMSKVSVSPSPCGEAETGLEEAAASLARLQATMEEQEAMAIRLKVEKEEQQAIAHGIAKRCALVLQEQERQAERL